MTDLPSMHTDPVGPLDARQVQQGGREHVWRNGRVDEQAGPSVRSGDQIGVCEENDSGHV